MPTELVDLFVSLCQNPNYMRKISCILMFVFAIYASAQRSSGRTSVAGIDSLTIHWKQYADSLQNLLDKYTKYPTVTSSAVRTAINPYLFPILSSATVYSLPLQQSMRLGSEAYRYILFDARDNQLVTLQSENDFLSKMYMLYPGLFKQTQAAMMEEGAMAIDVDSRLNTDVKLTDQIELTDIEHGVSDTIMAITRRPNFWTLKGSSSLQFTQSYFSDNWFQGGENNYSALGLLTLEANFDNKQKIQWENKLEAQLGFQTAKSDTCHTLKVTNNLLRLTSKLGYKVSKKNNSWFYTGQFQTYTQLYPNYQTNTKNVTTDFASPLYASLSLGLDFKLNKKRFSGSLQMSPLSVNMRYVNRPSLRSRYNDNADQAVKWTFGPRCEINYTWKIIDNITWQARLLWFSDFKYTNIEMENTFSFSINKYLNCKFFAYPKFLDNNTRYKNERGSYWMFKEFLSLGVSYSW